MDRGVPLARMSHAGFAFHLSLPHRAHRVLFHSGCLTVLQVVKGGKQNMSERMQSPGVSSPGFENQYNAGKTPEGILRKNTVYKYCQRWIAQDTILT